MFMNYFLFNCLRIAIKCPGHDAPQYGYVNFTGYRPDHQAQYSCHAGYKLVGVPYRTCGYDGVWSRVIPKCIRKLIFYCLSRFTDIINIIVLFN